MALNLGELIVQIGANIDTSSFNSGKKAVDGTTAAFDKYVNAAQRATNQVSRLETSLEDLQDSSKYVGQARSALEEYLQSVVSAANKTESLANANDSFRTSIDNVVTSVKKLNAETEKELNEIKHIIAAGKQKIAAEEAAAKAAEQLELNAVKHAIAAGKLKTKEEEKINQLRIAQAQQANAQMIKDEEVAIARRTAQHKAMWAKIVDQGKAFAESQKLSANSSTILADSLVQMGTRARGASNRLSGTTSKARNLGLGVQNAAYQFQDMIVQFEMGIDASRVLGQQLPQLLGGFGVLGAVAGVAAAAFFSLVPWMFKSGDEAEKAATKVDTYKQSLDDLKRITDNYEESQAKLNGTIREFELKNLIQAVEDSRKAFFKFDPAAGLKAWLGIGKNGVELSKDMEDAAKRLTEARDKQNAATENSLRTQINELKNIKTLSDLYKKGAMSEKEYELAKKFVVAVGNEELQGNQKLQKLLWDRLKLEQEIEKLTGKKKEPKNYDKERQAVEKLQMALIQSETILRNVEMSGTDTGVALEKAFSKQSLIKKWQDAIKPENLKTFTDALNMNGASADQVAVKLGNIDFQILQNIDSLNNYKAVLGEVGSLSDRIQATKTGGGIFAQMFTPDLVKNARAFEKETNSIASSLQTQMAGGDTGAITRVITEYSKVAKEAGMVKPFEGIDATNVTAVAAAVVKVKNEVASLEQMPQKIISAVSQIASQFTSLVQQMGSMYEQQASYHKQMAEEALNYGRSQSEMYMQLADTVHYSNNQQAQAYEQRAIAVAEATAKQYQAEKDAQAKANSMAKKAFEQQKQIQMAQAIMSTAVAVMDTYRNSGLGVWAAPLAAAMAAVGAAQVGIISQQQFTPRAIGGPVTGGQMYKINENGQEAFIPSTNGRIVNNKDLSNMLNGGGGNGDTIVNFNIQANDARGFDELLVQRRALIVNMMREAQNGNAGGRVI